MKTLFEGEHRLLVTLACLSLGFAGCESCKPGKDNHLNPLTFDLKIVPRALEGVSAEVDVIGLRLGELSFWERYDVTNYFSPGDLHRRAAARVNFQFPAGHQTVQTLKMTDDIWQKEWSKPGVEYLLVLASLPGHGDPGRPGGSDLRRLLLPRCKCYWKDKLTEVEVEINPSGLRLNTAYRPNWEQQLPATWYGP
jgi:hypothetical protein